MLRQPLNPDPLSMAFHCYDGGWHEVTLPPIGAKSNTLSEFLRGVFLTTVGSAEGACRTNFAGYLAEQYLTHVREHHAAGTYTIDQLLTFESRLDQNEELNKCRRIFAVNEKADLTQCPFNGCQKAEEESYGRFCG